VARGTQPLGGTRATEVCSDEVTLARRAEEVVVRRILKEGSGVCHVSKAALVDVGDGAHVVELTSLRVAGDGLTRALGSEKVTERAVAVGTGAERAGGHERMLADAARFLTDRQLEAPPDIGLGRLIGGGP
jgi:hypothetical protein